MTRTVKRAALAFLLLAVLQAAAGAGEPGWNVERYLCEDAEKPFFTPAPEARGLFRSARPYALFSEFLMPKPPGLKRILVAGESAAVILGPGARAFSSRPGAPALEVINSGMVAYESTRILEVLREGLRYSPDAVVVLSGNNEDLSDPCRNPGARARRLGRLLLEKYYGFFNVKREARQRASLRLHALALTKMARAAKKAGVPVVLCTLPRNLRGAPPSGGMSLSVEGTAAGYVSFYSGRPSRALNGFRGALAVDPDNGFLKFYSGKSLEKMGRSAEAAPYFEDRYSSRRNAVIREVAAREGACVADLDELFRSLSPRGQPGYGEFIDGVHWRSKMNKAVWDEMLRAAAACAGFPPDFAAGHPAIAMADAARVEAIKRLGYATLGASLGPGVGLNEAALSGLAEIKKDSPEVLGAAAVSPKKLNELLIGTFWSTTRTSMVDGLFPYFLMHLAEIERRGGCAACALKLCARALKLAPGDRGLLLERAQALADSGKREDAKLEFLALAGTEGPFSVEARSLAASYGLVPPVFGPGREASKKASDSALLKADEGDFEGAAALLREALRLDGGNPEALINMCSVLSRQDRPADAVRFCLAAGDAAGTEPRFAGLASDSRLEAYRLLASLGREKEARSALGEALRLAPPDWPRAVEARRELAGGK